MKKRSGCIILIAMLVLSFAGCENVKKTSTDNSKTAIAREAAETEVSKVGQKDSKQEEDGIVVTPLQSVLGEENVLEGSALKSGGKCYYMISVPDFCDSNEDGIGDLRGVIKALAYIENLGCDGICLFDMMSEEESTENISDYTGINEQYGSDEDFLELINACKKYEMKVLVTLNLNRVSSVSKIDLNKEVIREECASLYTKWLDKGIDGFYLAECNRYQTGNDAANIQFLEWTQQVLKEKKEDIVIVGEVYDNAETCNQYYKSGIESFVNGRFSGEYGMIARSILTYAGDYSGTILSQKICEVQPGIEMYDADALPAQQLSNNKQGRSSDYFYYNESQIKLAGAISLLMSGNSFLLYGEELGMGGVLEDTSLAGQKARDCMVPMDWSEKDDDTSKFVVTSNETDQEGTNPFGSYEEQMEDPLSIYNYYRQVLQVRDAFPSIADGKQECMEQLEDGAVCGIIKSCESETSYLLINTHNEEVSVTVPKNIYYYHELAAAIGTDENEIVLQDDTLLLPPYGIAVLK